MCLGSVMFLLYQFIVVLIACYSPVSSFDMWKIIETENEIKAPEKKGNFSIQHDSIRPLLYDGDILRDINKPQKSLTQMQAPFTWHQRLWVNREIPYEISGVLVDSTTIIISSLKKISNVTCLTFPEKKSTDYNWIRFFKGQGCFSGIGRKYWSQQETGISLGTNCVHPSIIVHEVLHAAGFPHEQSRIDRDSYVNIYTDRVLPSMLNNFEKNYDKDINLMQTEYDFKSIMHYSRRSFAKAPDGRNTIEHKFDPNFELGNSELSKSDIEEINKLYQCHIKSGWSEWSEWSDCMFDWRKQCVKAIVRFCLSKDLTKCPGVTEFGTQDIVEECRSDQCKELKINGVWGPWGSYSTCSSTCGWGTQVRYRECNNPSPMFGGKNCSGNKEEKFLCRNTRCGGASPYDLNFENNFGKWQFSGFVIRSKEDILTEGPSQDVTSVDQGKPYGFYAVASGKSINGTSPKYFIKSPPVTNFKGEKCLSFFYMLNGANLHTTEALSIYLIENSVPELLFIIGNHQGNYWNRVGINIRSRKQQFQIMIQAKHAFYGKSSVAVDNIFFDDNPCPAGLSGCKDLHVDCKSRALKGQCVSNWRVMVAECCTSCSDMILVPDVPSAPLFIECTATKDNHTKCEEWAKNDECRKNPWMSTYCCSSCKKYGKILCSTITNTNERCDKWAQSGQCQTNAVYMSRNCCPSCQKFDTVYFKA